MSAVACHWVLLSRTALRITSSLRMLSELASTVYWQLSLKFSITGLERYGRDHGHVQGASDLGATTLDTTVAGHATTVAVKGRQPGQRGDLFANRCAQLG